LKPTEDYLWPHVRTILGAVGYVLFLGVLIGMWGTLYVTFFVMHSGAASGVPLGIALFAFLILYPLSELLLFVGLRRPGTDKGAADR